MAGRSAGFSSLPRRRWTRDGRIGARLAASDVDVVAHVGSTATGRAVTAATARTGAKALLENGGNDPLVVDDDVDPVWAAQQAAVGAFTNAGQICTSVERIFVVREIAPEFLDALCERARAWNDAPQPLVDVRRRAHVADAVADGARVLVGGEIPDGPGAFYPATVLTDCTPAMGDACGNLRPRRAGADGAGLPAGLEAACANEYGLAATVLTNSMDHAQWAWRALPVGTVKINAVFGGAPGGAAQPRGWSGQGFGYGPELLDEMTTVKVVHGEPPVSR